MFKNSAHAAARFGLSEAGNIYGRLTNSTQEVLEKRIAALEGGEAALAAVKGYRIILTMPETMSVERQNILKAYGAKLVLTEGDKGTKGAIELAKRLENQGKTIVALLPDSGDRYYSTPLFSE